MKKLKILLLLFIAPPICFAQNVTKADAEMVAKNFMGATRYEQTKSVSLSQKAVNRTTTVQYKNKPSYYVVGFEGQGYVIVSAYDGYTPILGYSETGVYDENNLPPAYVWWMEGYSQTIDSLATRSIKQTISTTQWQTYRSANFDVVKSAAVPIKAAVSPLLTSQWSQGVPYNMAVSDGGKGANCSGGKCSVGCVALALGQIMRYWGYPLNSFDWCAMPNSLSTTSSIAQKNAVANLLADIGRRVKIVYCYKGDCDSGPNPATTGNDIFFGLQQYGCYTGFDHATPNVNITDFVQKYKNALSAGIPVFTEGLRLNVTTQKHEGHAFVIDGYDNSNKFHINWGWGGSSDGYFELEGQSFHIDMKALFSLRPGSNSEMDCYTFCDAGSVIEQSSAPVLGGPWLFPETLERYLHNPPVFGTFFTANCNTYGMLNRAYPATYYTIKSGKTANYKAYTDVTLQSGFAVEKGAALNIEIIPCPAKCSYPNK